MATKLLGPYAGLVAGSALIVDYLLTIAVSATAAVDAAFSLLPLATHTAKLPAAAAIVLLLAFLNLRGIKETVQVLLPIFLGFLMTHTGLVAYGLIAHSERLLSLFPNTTADATAFVDQVGLLALLSIILRAYSLGAGTYTGIEAVSNNVNMLAEPRVRTGRITMLYMALSLSFMAGGLTLTYLLWDVNPVPGETLNATVFRSAIASFGIKEQSLATIALMLPMTFAAGLLIVAANTGFLGGPAVLANMATDRWMPHQFTHLSTRLVTSTGIALMAVASLTLILLTGGRVDELGGTG